MFRVYSISFILAVEVIHGARAGQPFGRDVGVASNGEDLLKLSATSVLLHKFQALDQKLNEILRRLDKQRETTSLCQKSWTRFGGSCYKINTKKEDWATALLKCREEGGYLAEIDDEAEGHFIKEEAMLIQDSLWLGGSDLVREGHWQWATSKKKISDDSFTDWLSGEPSNGGGNEHCLHIYKGIRYEWNDVPCKNKNGYVCKRQPNIE